MVEVPYNIIPIHLYSFSSGAARAVLFSFTEIEASFHPETFRRSYLRLLSASSVRGFSTHHLGNESPAVRAITGTRKAEQRRERPSQNR